MNYNELKDIINDIDASYQDIPFQVFHGQHEGRIWIQVGTKRPDTYTGKIAIGKGGKVYVSEFATDDEVVKKIFGLCLAYVEHETREFFKYKGVRVFNPHISLDAHLEMAKRTTYRKNGSTGVIKS